MIEPQESAAGREQPIPLRRFGHEAMACTFELRLVEEDEAYAGQAARAAFAEVDRLEQELSRFVATSDIARINALEAGRTTRIAIETLECLQLAAQVCNETGGAFDITFGSRDDPTQPRDTVPLVLDPHGRCVGVRTDGIQVDLGGMGKGYAVDQMVAILREWSIAAGLVHCGQSTVFARGCPAGAKGWSVGIRNPLKHDDILGSVQISDGALSGSGRKLHGDHIVDPRSGRTVDDRLGAWALAPSAALSDALATAFMVMAPDEVAAYCQHHPTVSALLLTRVGEAPDVLCFGTGLALRGKQGS